MNTFQAVCVFLDEAKTLPFWERFKVFIIYTDVNSKDVLTSDLALLRQRNSLMVPFSGIFEIFSQQIRMFKDSILTKIKRNIVFEGKTSEAKSLASFKLCQDLSR